MTEDQLYFIGLKAFIIKGGKLLVLNDPEMGIDMPGGKIQVGEFDLENALKREVMEETGLEIEVGNPVIHWFFQIPVTSKHRSAGKIIFNIGYLCKYIKGEVKLSQEHNSYHWIDKSQSGDYIGNKNIKKAIKEFFEK